MRWRSCLVAALAAFAIAILVAACGGGGSDTTGSSTTETEAETETGGGTETASSEGASGPAIHLATAVPVTGQGYQAPEMAEGMEAAMEAINAEGGVEGHRLELAVCDTNFTANGETGCARQIIGEKADAIVAPFMLADSSGASWPILEKAGIPAIGQQGASLAELNSPYVFPLGSSFVGPYAGTAVVAAEQKAKKVVIVADDPNPVAKPVEELISGVLKSKGITDVTVVTGHTQSDPTFATAGAEAVDKSPDAVILTATPNNVATMIKALHASGYEGKLIVPTLLLPEQSIEALGSEAEGIYVTSATAFESDESNPGIQKFKEEMDQYAPGVAQDDAALEGWSGMHLFADAAAGAKSFDSAGLQATFEKVAKPIELGTSGPWSVVGKTNKIPGFSRIVNPTIVTGQIEGGVYKSSGSGEFVNPFAPPGH
jgi:branched-chain amino acid transport system substrate-binding protein